jgi:hypothetical protein
MAGKSSPPKRKNRTVQLGDVVGGMLDPALRRRGFANRELIVNSPSIAPAPWNRATLPDKLVWPRKDRPDPEGAVLYVRCLESHKVMLPHEAPAIAMAINRYFGYLLVRTVRLSLNAPTRRRAGTAKSEPGSAGQNCQRDQGYRRSRIARGARKTGARGAGQGQTVSGRRFFTSM